MAELVLKSSIDVLGKVLVEKGKYLWGAEEKLKELQVELLWMQTFLREAETFEHKDETFSMRIHEVQSYVYEAGDIIDEFVIQVASQRQHNDSLNKLRRYSCIFRELYYLHQTASSIDSLKAKISSLSPKLEKYSLKGTLGENIHHDEVAQVEQIHYILKNAHLEDKKIVGLRDNAEEIINNLTSPRLANRRFHAIYGMGGLGKTTLATEVFKDGAIKQHFTGGQAFVYISKKFHVESVIEAVHTHLKVPRPENVNESLELQLQKFLKEKKCLVVLDDVWTKEAWDCLRSAFGLCDRDSGSKVLLTTRKEHVAKHVDIDALQKPLPLKYRDAWELLKKTMGWDREDPQSSTSSNQIQDEINTVDTNDVSEKINLAKKMLEVCKGVPLFIVVLGGILRKKQTLFEWKFVFDNITSHLRKGYDHGRSCKEILLLSYDDLPYYLKACFLHLASFPEDYKILTESLYRMWAAEGLVTRSTYDRTTCTKCLEDVANDYLNDLAQVGLVEIVDATPEGWIKSIRMHDLVRDVCYEKAVTDNVLTTIDLRSSLDQELNTSDYSGMKRLLRMTIYLCSQSIKSLNEDSLSSKAPKYLRSLLLLLLSNEDKQDPDECRRLMACICSEFQFLRVLVIENKFRLDGRLTSQIENLIHLRYLSLANTAVSELPSCIDKLRFLEILDLRVRDELVVPNTLWKLFRLRHLLFPIQRYEIKGSKRLRIDTLICLEVFENLLLDNLEMKGMRKIKNLRKLSIKHGVSKEAIMDIIPVFKSIHLRSCLLEIRGDVISESPTMLSGIFCNFQLKIFAPIQGVGIRNVNLPQRLQVLELRECLLQDDPMSILGSLAHLKSLHFEKDSYVGRKLSCHPNSFPLLEKLVLAFLEKLEVWELGSGSMPKLNALGIFSCSKLNGIPDVLPLSLQEFCSRYNSEHQSDLERLENAVLNGESVNIVLLGKGREGRTTAAMEPRIKRHFDGVARTWVPRRRSRSAGGGLIPRCNLQQLLKDIHPRLNKDLSRMSCDDLMTEVQQVMQKKKCLVILLNLEVDDDHLQADLEKTFGNPRSYAETGSKLLITFESDIESSLPTVECQVLTLAAPTSIQTWEKICNYDRTNGGIKWNMMRHCLGDQLSAEMSMELLKRKENITEWASEHKELTDPSPIEFSQIFALCYNDLQLHLRHCLLYLSIFPEELEISAKKLHQMWIAAGIVGSKQDDVQLAEPLENLAISYLTELVQRGMVYVLKRGPDEIAKTCQLKFALRDLCLAKAKEEQKLEFPMNHASLAIQMDQNSVSPASLIKKLSFLEDISSPTSLLFFPDVSDPLYNEENWEWLLHICKHFQLLRVLDLEGMWITKGSLPKEIGHLTHLRYLSLKGTWVTQLPQSIEDLSHLQTLDLRVWEPIIIPDVLWKLHQLMHLYLPDFIAQETTKLRLSGLNRLVTLVNLQTNKACMTDLPELKLLRKITIRNIHAVGELDGILKQLSTSLEVYINSEIINANSTILAGFQNLRKLKIKGIILSKLDPEMLPANLEEVTMKRTQLKEDPLPVLEKLPQLIRVFLDHESFLGKTMTFSIDFHVRANLKLCSLSNLEKLYVPAYYWRKRGNSIEITDCWRLTKEYLPSGYGGKDEEEEEMHMVPKCFDLSPLRKVNFSLGFVSSFQF